MWQKDFSTMVHCLAENRLGLVESAGHIDVMRAHSGKHEDNRAFSLFPVCSDHSFGIACGKNMLRVVNIFADDDSAIFQRLAPYLECVRHIGEIEFSMV